MRKIESKMLTAIARKEDWQLNNTIVEIEDNKITVKLYNNLIAIITSDTLIVSSCKYKTKTTKSRLNAILHHFSLDGIYQKDYVWYINKDKFEDGMTFKI